MRPSGRSAMYSGRRGPSFLPCSWPSCMPGDEIEPTTKRLGKFCKGFDQAADVLGRIGAGHAQHIGSSFTAMIGGPKSLRIEAKGGHCHLIGTKRYMVEEILSRMIGDCDDVVNRFPSIPDQPLLDSAVQVRTGTELRKQQRLDVVDGGDEFPAFPGHA